MCHLDSQVIHENFVYFNKIFTGKIPLFLCICFINIYSTMSFSYEICFLIYSYVTAFKRLNQCKHVNDFKMITAFE